MTIEELHEYINKQSNHLASLTVKDKNEAAKIVIDIAYEFSSIDKSSFPNKGYSDGFVLAKENVLPSIIEEANGIINNDEAYSINDGFFGLRTSLFKMQSWLRVER